MTRKQWVLLGAVGAAAWLMTAIYTAPATVIPAVIGEVSGMRLDRASGSMRQGSARLLAPSGVVGNVSWDLHGTALLSGQLRLSLTLDGPQVALHGTVVHSPFSGATRIEEVDGTIAMALLAELSGIDRLVDANIAVNAVNIYLQDRQLTGIGGTADLGNVTLLYPRRTLLGQYTLQFGQTDGWMHANVTESTGPLAASGELGLTATGEWRMNLRLQAEDPSGDIAQGLAFVGPADELGRRHLVYSGQL